MVVKPITPVEAKKAKQVRVFPDGVIRAFNELIAASLSNGEATVYQKTVVKKICEYMECDADRVFAERWLDVEPVYRKAGWKVFYDKPVGWGGDNYEAHWDFTKRGGSYGDD